MTIFRETLQVIADDVAKRNQFNLRSFRQGVADCKIGRYDMSLLEPSCFSRELYDLGWLSYFHSHYSK